MSSSNIFSAAQAFVNSVGAIVCPVQFPGKGRLTNWIGRKVSRFTPDAECHPVPGAQVIVSLSDRVGRLMWTGCYERELERLFRSTLSSGIRVVDVGAQIGYFTVIAAALVNPGGAVYSFEPDPGCFSRLVQNSRRYPWIAVFNTAVADRTGEIQFFCSPKQDESGWGAIFNENGRRAQLVVPVCTLDSWRSINGIESVDLLKIDVEGAECRVLKGAQAMIADTRPIIYVEANDVCLARDSHTVSSILRYLALSRYVAKGIWNSRSHSFENILAVPEERTDLIEKVRRAKLDLRTMPGSISP